MRKKSNTRYHRRGSSCGRGRCCCFGGRCCCFRGGGCCFRGGGCCQYCC